MLLLDYTRRQAVLGVYVAASYLSVPQAAAG